MALIDSLRKKDFTSCRAGARPGHPIKRHRPGYSVTSSKRPGTRHSPNGIYGICAASASASLRLDVGCQDHLAPFHGLVGDKLGEIGGRARQHGRAEIGEPRLEVGIGKARIDLRVQPFDDLCGRYIRQGNAERCRLWRSRASPNSEVTDVVLASGTRGVMAIQQVNRPVPVVFALVADPVGAGFVDSLARPGGNATGFMLYEYSISGKWLELLKEIAPGVTRVASGPRHTNRFRPYRDCEA
jgi:hypothetical protein